MGHAYKYFRLPLPSDRTLLVISSTRIPYHRHFFSLLNQCQNREMCQVLVILIVLSRPWCLLINILGPKDPSKAEDTTIDYKAYADVFQGLSTYVCSSRPQVLQYLNLSFIKSIFLAGAIVGFLALVISFSGVDFHGLSGLTLRFGLACLILSTIAGFLSVVNTILFTMLASAPAGDIIKEKVHKILYEPDISLPFCILLVGAANWCGGLSILFLFIQFDHPMIFVYLALLVFSFFGYGPVFAVAIGVYFTLLAKRTSWSA